MVFYSVLGNADKPDLLKQDLNEIRKMPFQALKTQLLPMLHTKLGHFDKDRLFDVAINYLTRVRDNTRPNGWSANGHRLSGDPTGRLIV